MNPLLGRSLIAMRAAGWLIEMKDVPSLSLPAELGRRYGHMPAEFQEFLCHVKSCVNSTDTAWILCEDDYRGTNPSNGYRWNEFEQICLAGIGDHPDWVAQINRHWTQHMPIALSVKDGYSYLAMDMLLPDPKPICYGREPEFEGTDKVCDSFSDLLLVLAGMRSGPDELELEFR